MEILFYNNGSTVVFDEDDNQIPRLQANWLDLFIQFLVKNGINPETQTFHLPNGKIAKVFKTTHGTWNWRIEE